MFYKPGQGDKLFKKLGYAVYNRAFDIIIGTGYYVDNLDEIGKRKY